MPVTPNLFIPGAMKAGTTQLAELLATHQDIFSGPIKEPNFYCRELHEAGIRRESKIDLRFNVDEFVKNGCQGSEHHAYVESEEVYRALYTKHSGQKWVLDASTTYLPSPVAARLIAEAVPNAKAIIIVRPAAERAWSEFQMNQAIGITDSNYRAALERENQLLRNGRPPLFERYVSAGLYTQQIDAFRNLLGHDSVLVLNFADLKDQLQLLASIADFLSIDPFDDDALKNSVNQNSARLPRHPLFNRFIAKTGIKPFVQRLVPAGIKPLLRRMTYTAGQRQMPEDFAAAFAEFTERHVQSSSRKSH